MRTYGRIVGLSVAVIVIIASGWYVAVHTESIIAFVTNGAEGHRFLSATVLAVVMFITTICAPLTALPLIPLIAPLLGPFTTGLAAFVGWTFGAVGAFLIARYGGRPLLERMVDLERLALWEAKLPPTFEFMGIVALRMLVPVDILSYALGALSTVSLPMYTTATMLGIVWFSFAFAYGGSAILTGNYVLLASIGVASGIVLSVAWLYLRKMRAKKSE